MPEENQNTITSEKAESVSYVFPASEEIVIRKSDLQIQLDKFKERIRSSFSVFDLLAIVSIWSPIFSADFKQLISLTSVEVKAGYFVFATIITVFIIWTRCRYFLFRLWKKDNVSTNSEEMAKKILEQCQSQSKSS